MSHTKGKAKARRWLHGMLSWLVMLAMRGRNRSCCSAVLSCNQTQATPIALSGIISSFDSLSPHLIRGHNMDNKIGKRQAADHMMGWDQGVSVHRCLTQIHAPSVCGPRRHG